MPDGSLLTGKYIPRGSGIYMPFAWTTVVSENGESNPIMTLMDTGASVNVLSMEVAIDALQKSRDEIQQGALLTGHGFGDAEGSPMWGWTTNLRLRATPQGQEAILIQNVRVFITENVSDHFPLLFGQFGGFQQRLFRHHNHDSRRFWQLTQDA